MAKNTHLKRQIVLQFNMEKFFGLRHPMAMFVQGVPSIGTHFRFQFLTFRIVLSKKYNLQF